MTLKIPQVEKRTAPHRTSGITPPPLYANHFFVDSKRYTHTYTYLLSRELAVGVSFLRAAAGWLASRVESSLLLTRRFCFLARFLEMLDATAVVLPRLWCCHGCGVGYRRHSLFDCEDLASGTNESARGIGPFRWSSLCKLQLVVACCFSAARVVYWRVPCSVTHASSPGRGPSGDRDTLTIFKLSPSSSNRSSSVPERVS